MGLLKGDTEKDMGAGSAGKPGVSRKAAKSRAVSIETRLP